MRVHRYLLVAMLRAAAPMALGLSALLVTIDALDPSAAGEPFAALLGRWPSLVAVALVVTAILSPAAALTALGQNGALRALECAGGRPGRSLAPMALVTALACALGAQGASGLHLSAHRPSARPLPLEVEAFGAPRTGHWRSVRGQMAWVARAPSREAPPMPLGVAAMAGGALVAAWLWRTRVATVRGVWRISAGALLVVVVGSVLAVNFSASRPRAQRAGAGAGEAGAGVAGAAGAASGTVGRGGVPM